MIPAPWCNSRCSDLRRHGIAAGTNRNVIAGVAGDRVVGPVADVERVVASDDVVAVSAVHGVVRAFMLGDHLAYMQPVYQWTPGAVPRLLHVVYLVGDSVRVAPTLRQASGVVIPPRGASPGSPVETRRLTARLYQDMRDALRRGDWLAFGRAFDALGRLLGVRAP